MAIGLEKENFEFKLNLEKHRPWRTILAQDTPYK